MKLSSSPSVSSSTTSNTFSGIFPTTKGSVSGFLSLLLRTILCSTKLPTHPSDQLKEIDQIEHSMKPHKPDDDSATPNLVARLMGLDSMPQLPSITRSKSMNSVGCKAGETEELQGQHRRVKTSVSFRETPSFFELEDDDFFVISFENGGKNRKPRSRKAKPEMGGREIEQRRRRRVDKEQGRRPMFKISETSSEALVLEIDNCDQVRKGRDRRKKKDKFLEGAIAESESGSENSSPVSVLDHSLFISDHEAPTSEEDTRNQSYSPRRKLVQELSNLGHPSSDSNNRAFPERNDQNPIEANKGKRTGPRRKRCKKPQNMEMLNQVSRLAKAEIMTDLEWKCEGGLMRNLKNWEADIGMELGLQIVDQLVDEMVHQLIY